MLDIVSEMEREDGGLIEPLGMGVVGALQMSIVFAGTERQDKQLLHSTLLAGLLEDSANSPPPTWGTCRGTA